MNRLVYIHEYYICVHLNICVCYICIYMPCIQVMAQLIREKRYSEAVGLLSESPIEYG